MLGLITNIRHAIAGDAHALKPVYAQLIAVAIFVVFTRLYRPRNAAGRFLGEISYSVYLFHPVLFYPLFLYWFQHSPWRSVPHIFIVLAMLLTVAFSALTYRYLEKPFIALGKKRFSGNSLPLPVAA
jgi:peptidoglycan/LPS O-acetylase OafA/YrhL